MALESVTTHTESEEQAGTEHGLWIGDKRVLTIGLDINSDGFPPQRDHVIHLNAMIQGLARAAKSVIYQAENDPSGGEVEFQMQPIGDIADAIILLSQLSGAVSHEVDRNA